MYWACVKLGHPHWVYFESCVEVQSKGPLDKPTTTTPLSHHSSVQIFSGKCTNQVLLIEIKLPTWNPTNISCKQTHFFNINSINFMQGENSSYSPKTVSVIYSPRDSGCDLWSLLLFSQKFSICLMRKFNKTQTLVQPTWSRKCNNNNEWFPLFLSSLLKKCCDWLKMVIFYAYVTITEIEYASHLMKITLKSRSYQRQQRG